MLDIIQILEILVIVFTLLYNYFLIKQHIVCWLFGLFSSLIGAIIFYHKLLMGQSLLHLFYAIMAMYGWYVWNQKKEAKNVREWTLKKQILIILIGVAFIAIIYPVFYLKLQIEMSLADLSITIFCIIATYKEAQKIVSAWLYWIVLNFTAALLYWNNELQLYACLMIVYTILSVSGYFTWKKQLQNAHA